MAQVRQPLYRTSVERWRRYEAQLAPLRAALGPLVERYEAGVAAALRAEEEAEALRAEAMGSGGGADRTEL